MTDTAVCVCVSLCVYRISVRVWLCECCCLCVRGNGGHTAFQLRSQSNGHELKPVLLYTPLFKKIIMFVYKARLNPSVRPHHGRFGAVVAQVVRTAAYQSESW